MGLGESLKIFKCSTNLLLHLRLVDTIVHFGERGSIAWPINWNGASRAAEKADMILCLGSSLKVRYQLTFFFGSRLPAPNLNEFCFRC